MSCVVCYTEIRTRRTAQQGVIHGEQLQAQQHPVRLRTGAPAVGRRSGRSDPPALGAAARDGLTE